MIVATKVGFRQPVLGMEVTLCIHYTVSKESRKITPNCMAERAVVKVFLRNLSCCAVDNRPLTPEERTYGSVRQFATCLYPLVLAVQV